MITGFTCSTFELLHPGHILMLKECKEHCDYLVVGLHVDPSRERKEKNKPIESVFERYMRVKSNIYVDEVIPYETEEDLRGMLIYLNPDIRFIGIDWIAKEYTAKDLLIPIHWTKRRHDYSSTNLRRRIIKQ